jgi:hypothetical protein
MAKKIKQAEEKVGEILNVNPSPRIHVLFSKTVQIEEEWHKAEASADLSIESLEETDEAYEKLWELVGNQVDGILGIESEEDPEEEEEDSEEEGEEEEEEDPEEEEEEGEEDSEEEDPEEEEGEEEEGEEEGEEEEEDPEEEEGEEEEEDPEEEGEDDDGEEEEISEDDINEMAKTELIELCKTAEGLEDINTKLKLKPLRKAIIKALFEESDWEKTEWEE